MLHVNKALIPLKLFFFNYLGGLACIVPYMPVFMFHLGFNESEVGVIYGILPFIGLLSKPLGGIVADKLNAHRLVLVVALTIQAVFTFVVYYLPPVPLVTSSHSLQLSCNQQLTTIRLSTNGTIFCGEDSSKLVQCYFRDPDPYVFRALNISPQPMPIEFTVTKRSWPNVTNDSTNADPSGTMFPVELFYQGQNRTTCVDSVSSSNCSANICPDSSTQSTPFVRFSFQFWLLLIVLTISRVGYAATYSISDSVAFDLISQQKKPVSYGMQRAFGSLGWASAAVVVGFLLDKFSNTVKDYQIEDYAPAFYGFVILIGFAIVTALFLKPSENIRSTQVLKNIVKLFEDGEFIIFSIGAFLVGMLTGLLYTFLFIYIESELKAVKLVMGLTQLAECFGEAPFMFLSSWIITRMGHHGAMTAALASFCIRYIGYSLLGENYWWILILELFHGPGFGLFYANMATFANTVAPAGAAATMQGVLGGIYDAFGIGFGGLVGGAVYYRFGGRLAWRGFGVAAGIAAILYAATAFYVYRRKARAKMLSELNNGSLQDIATTTNGYETPIPPDTPSEKERLTT
ncbi:major facilitator superfamily domain-containing protein 6-like [Paramacrobiotus metropolitanus]|uniref:major facilitator superfamily domain-containing protein 6-like n=1 Tax=Paramacrobiotus metropolitanus TaxID=2943436 RepID=UPI002445C69F|nr:major facilitator superfamily domain-containing protein 6-like [Paramacrobiotus metropolitanus]